ncbi:suppressor of fused domain protein [Patulibacter minatonensis]|uniref:suppressor of fused domain protein n=1 Tax=Patulibacter minatonensis TaxID=298163 RepID=UPI0004798575|nr:suppressor of fused domain protein [Patulibacter minatonensis]
MPDQGPPDAVRAAFAAHYGDGARIAAADRGGALRGIAVHRGEGLLHLVTIGLAARVPQGRDGAPDAGPLGHELTVLLPAADEPPAWAFSLLDGAARTALSVGRPFHAGARMAPGGAVDGAGSGLVAVGVRADPVIDPPGPVEVLQLVSVTAGEYLLMQRVGTALVLDRLAVRDPLLRTDPSRA